MAISPSDSARNRGGTFCHRQPFIELLLCILTVSAFSTNTIAAGDDGNRRAALVIREIEPLSFGRIITQSNRETIISIEPQTGHRHFGGSTAEASGFHKPAHLLIEGEPNAKVRLLLPHSRSSDRRNEAVLENFRCYPEGPIVLAPNGRAEVFIGADLRLPPRFGRPVRTRISIDAEYLD